ncbi:MAG: sulfotransferase family 2 domain-containing protein [Tsuneonella sp.]
MLRRFLRLRHERREGIEQVFHQQGAIFVHIPKAAGSAVSITLFGQQIGHSTIGELRDRDPAAVRNYFSFAFVREPLDRLQSAFYYLQGGGMNEADQLFSESHVRGLTFAQFVENLAAQDQLRQWWHFRPQHEFVLLKNAVGVNFVGRYEKLDADFAEIARRLDRPELRLPVLNASARPAASVDSRTRRLAEAIYARDYEVFGY